MRKRAQGFTAVELLITLFVAVGFLVAGYQLYFIVIKDNGITRAQAKASNVAYNYLRQYAGTATAPCSPSTPLNGTSQNVAGLTNVTVTVGISCPYSTSTGTNSAINISRIDVSVTYGPTGQTQTVKEVTYAHDTPNASTSTDITSGLLDWWKLNGNAQASVGVDGVVSNATLTTGQNGQANSAYSFNGSNASISFGMNNWPATINSITVSFWAKSTNTGAPMSVIDVTPDDIANRLNIHFPWSDGTIYWDLGNYQTTGRLSTPYNASWYNAWTFWTFTTDATAGMNIYRNGVNIASTTNHSTFTTAGKTFVVGSYNSGVTWWTGSLDDVRVYNRALTQQEAQTMYNNGAQ